MTKLFASVRLLFSVEEAALKAQSVDGFFSNDEVEVDVDQLISKNYVSCAEDITEEVVQDYLANGGLPVGCRGTAEMGRPDMVAVRYISWIEEEEEPEEEWTELDSAIWNEAHRAEDAHLEDNYDMMNGDTGE